ncbi:unnamed protein product [Closterium sp. NIES-53]
MGKAMFKGADGKMVGLKNVLWVPNLAANLISVRRLQKAGMDTSSKGAKTYTARLGERILWDLHEDRDVYNEMWQIPVVPMPKERQVAASISTKGEAVGSGVGANGRAKKCNLGGTSKLSEHEESGAAAKKQHKGEENPKAAADEEYGESISEVTAMTPLDEVVMDVVGPLKLGAAGAEYFLTIVDVYTRMTWVYMLSKKSNVAEAVKTDWLPMVGIRIDRGGEFLSKEFSLWLKKNGIRHSLTMPYSLAMNDITERANRTITETARGLLIEARLPDYFWPDAVRNPFTKKYLVSRDCKFMQNLMYKDWKAENEVKIGVRFGEVKSSSLEHVELPLELSSGSTTTRQSSLVNGGEEAKDAEEEEEEVQQVSERAPTLPSRTMSAPRIRVTPQQRQGLHVPAAEEEGRGKRRIQAPNRLTYDALGKPAKSALAGAVLEEEIFMAQPEGFDDGSGRVLKLKKALYGLKQAPRQWYLKLRGVLEEIGFTPSTADHSLFMLGKGEQRSFMVVYMDDILIFSPSTDLMKEVMLKHQDKLKCKALRDVSFYLGLHIERDVEKWCMRVHQLKYQEALAAIFGQSEGHVATPFPSEFKCVKGPEEESVGEEERRRFHSLVGSLMYAAVNT